MRKLFLVFILLTSSIFSQTYRFDNGDFVSFSNSVGFKMLIVNIQNTGQYKIVVLAYSIEAKQFISGLGESKETFTLVNKAFIIKATKAAINLLSIIHSDVSVKEYKFLFEKLIGSNTRSIVNE